MSTSTILLYYCTHWYYTARLLVVVAALQSTPQVDFSDNPMSQSSFAFYDGRLLEMVKQGDPHVHQFFRLLALCHTVMPEEKSGISKFVVTSKKNNNSSLSVVRMNNYRQQEVIKCRLLFVLNYMRITISVQSPLIF